MKPNLTDFNISPTCQQSSVHKVHNPCTSPAFWQSALVLMSLYSPPVEGYWLFLEKWPLWFLVIPLVGCSSWINMWFQSRSLTPSSNRFPAHLNSGSFVFNSLSNLACCQHVPRGSTCDSNNDLWPTHPTGFQRNLTLEALFSTLCQTQGMQE